MFNSLIYLLKELIIWSNCKVIFKQKYETTMFFLPWSILASFFFISTHFGGVWSECCFSGCIIYTSLPSFLCCMNGSFIIQINVWVKGKKLCINSTVFRIVSENCLCFIYETSKVFLSTCLCKYKRYFSFKEIWEVMLCI